MQTDASDESWGVILLEETHDKEHFIAYASGHFSDTQIHYHSVYKEILAVKHGIQKFEYHLIGYHFLVRMDNSAFPNIMNFKGKNVPEKMLLCLKDWFSKYDFSVQHIKGDNNLILDMLSVLNQTNPCFSSPQITIFLLFSWPLPFPHNLSPKNPFPLERLLPQSLSSKSSPNS